MLFSPCGFHVHDWIYVWFGLFCVVVWIKSTSKQCQKKHHGNVFMSKMWLKWLKSKRKFKAKKWTWLFVTGLSFSLSLSLILSFSHSLFFSLILSKIFSQPELLDLEPLFCVNMPTMVYFYIFNWVACINVLLFRAPTLMRRRNESVSVLLKNKNFYFVLGCCFLFLFSKVFFTPTMAPKFFKVKRANDGMLSFGMFWNVEARITIIKTSIYYKIKLLNTCFLRHFPVLRSHQ